MASVIFPEKDFSRIFSDVHRYNTVFLDRIRERQWYGLVYDNTDLDVYYCPDLVKQFYLGIYVTTINHDHFVVHLDQGNLRSAEVLLNKPPKSHPPLSMLHHCP